MRAFQSLTAGSVSSASGPEFRPNDWLNCVCSLNIMLCWLTIEMCAWPGGGPLVIAYGVAIVYAFSECSSWVEDLFILHRVPSVVCAKCGLNYIHEAEKAWIFVPGWPNAENMSGQTGMKLAEAKYQ